MDINNTRLIHKIVEDTLRKAQNKEWDFNEFIVMGMWKPKKKNLCNNHFMGHMRERNERISDSSERFSYIVVKDLPLYNKESRKESHRVGDFMEYVNITKEQNMKIDINYYLGTTVRMCAHFINEDDKYQPPLHIKSCNSRIRMKRKSRSINIPRTKQKKSLKNILRAYNKLSKYS